MCGRQARVGWRVHGCHAVVIARNYVRLMVVCNYVRCTIVRSVRLCVFGHLRVCDGTSIRVLVVVVVVGVYTSGTGRWSVCVRCTCVICVEVCVCVCVGRLRVCGL